MKEGDARGIVVRAIGVPRIGALRTLGFGVCLAAALALLVALLSSSGSESGRRVATVEPHVYQRPSALTMHSPPPLPWEPLTVHWYGATVGSRNRLELLAQVQEAGRWKAFESVTAIGGRYAFIWQFHHRVRPVTYLFRVVLPRDAARDARAVASNVVRVRVE
jgi:hypothetical protein